MDDFGSTVRSPDSRDAISVEPIIAAEQRHAFGDCLSHEEPVEGVAVVLGERGDVPQMFDRDRQEREPGGLNRTVDKEAIWHAQIELL